MRLAWPGLGDVAVAQAAISLTVLTAQATPMLQTLLIAIAPVCPPTSNFTDVCVAEGLLSVQAYTDVSSVGRRGATACAGSLVVPTPAAG